MVSPLSPLTQTKPNFQWQIITFPLHLHYLHIPLGGWHTNHSTTQWSGGRQSRENYGPPMMHWKSDWHYLWAVCFPLECHSSTLQMAKLLRGSRLVSNPIHFFPTYFSFSSLFYFPVPCSLILPSENLPQQILFNRSPILDSALGNITQYT